MASLMRTHIQTANGQYVAVDTANTFDAGWETMVFRSNGKEIVSFKDLDCMRYDSRQEAMKGHSDMIIKWRASCL